MTRKDYIAIADAFREARYHWLYVMDQKPLEPADAFKAGYEAARAEIARVLASDNPRFDRQRFYDACEGSKA